MTDTKPPRQQEQGHLVGGPCDGTTFSMDGFFQAFQDSELTEPARKVFTDPTDHLGRVFPFWRGGQFAAPTWAAPVPLALYEADPDDPDWKYRFVGQFTPAGGQAGQTLLTTDRMFTQAERDAYEPDPCPTCGGLGETGWMDVENPGGVRRFLLLRSLPHRGSRDCAKTFG